MNSRGYRTTTRPSKAREDKKEGEGMLWRKKEGKRGAAEREKRRSDDGEQDTVSTRGNAQGNDTASHG